MHVMNQYQHHDTFGDHRQSRDKFMDRHFSADFIFDEQNNRCDAVSKENNRKIFSFTAPNVWIAFLCISVSSLENPVIYRLFLYFVVIFSQYEKGVFF